MKKWKCLVCGYIHEGDVPPDICPVCGADKSKFILLEEDESKALSETDVQSKVEESQSQAPETDGPSSEKKTDEKIDSPGKKNKKEFLKKIFELIQKYHGHPISVHIPNGVLPFSVLFTLIAFLFGSIPFAIAAKFNMMAVFISMPLVLFTGYVDWKGRFGGNATKIFIGKMICGGCVTLLSGVISIWWIMDPAIATGTSPQKWIFLMLNATIMIPAIIAGYLGGKLVFHYQQ